MVKPPSILPSIENVPLVQRFIRYIQEYEYRAYARDYLFWRVDRRSLYGDSPSGERGREKNYYLTRSQIRKRIDELLEIPKSFRW